MKLVTINGQWSTAKELILKHGTSVMRRNKGGKDRGEEGIMRGGEGGDATTLQWQWHEKG